MDKRLMRFKEAKEKCIVMWEYIAANITDKEWRDKAIAHQGFGIIALSMKRFAIHTLYFGDDPAVSCYLCELLSGPFGCAPNDDDSSCPLWASGRCYDYGQFCKYIRANQYARAAGAANRLVERVRAWEIEDWVS